jgi:hypothetical protein
MRSIALLAPRRLSSRAALVVFGLATAVPFGLSATPVSAQAAPTLSVNNVSVTEGNPGSPQRFASFIVSLSAPAPAAISFRVDTASGVGANAAIEGTDYTGVHGTRVIGAGAAATTVNVPILADTTFEPNEQFTLNLSGSVVTITRPTGTGTIVNDDPLPAVRISDARVAEGNSGVTSVVLNISLSNPASQPVEVRFATADGPPPNGAIAGQDYAAASGVARFLPGQTLQRIILAVNGDTRHEPDEVFFVNLGGAVNATIADPQATVTILNDDPIPTLSIKNSSITEGNAGVSMAHLTVGLSNTTSDTVKFDFETANGTAVEPSDYVASSGSKSIAPGTLSTTVDVEVSGDRLIEPSEVMHVLISNPVNAVLGNAVGDLTITNDDPILVP